MICIVIPDYILKENTTIFNNDKVFEGAEGYVNNSDTPVMIRK